MHLKPLALRLLVAIPASGKFAADRGDERSKKLQDRGVEVVYGDLLDFGQVKAALNGVQRAYFVYAIRPGILLATAYFAQAAKEAGVDGIVNMS